MAHQVTCQYCKERFDRDKEPFVEVSPRRYAHQRCADSVIVVDTRTQEEKDYEALEKYIKHLFSEDYVNAKIRKQIKDYRQTYNYSFSGMLKTLKWWYEIKGNTTEKANQGIGIIPFVYDDACKYYYSLWLAENINADTEYKYVVEEVEIAPPQVWTAPPKLFNFEEVEE